MQTESHFFLYLLKDSDNSLWDGCTNHSKLSVIAHVFTIKSYYWLNDTDYDKII
jgi:predicted GIY-YIG superfamily endonuclease